MHVRVRLSLKSLLSYLNFASVASVTSSISLLQNMCKVVSLEYNNCTLIIISELGFGRVVARYVCVCKTMHEVLTSCTNYNCVIWFLHQLQLCDMILYRPNYHSDDVFKFSICFQAVGLFWKLDSLQFLLFSIGLEILSKEIQEHQVGTRL